ncbi:hypothetical protein [Blastococcus sp. PRF04-17]|uniref:hypothetical protein n=1 Tax=Blastococcus sp. PRF04-17 TaxID=2933797 RepID=UPI001FF5CA7E|nr:hypothetical protein [Blastococcus sp. PRF04-17]UOY03037.1 hypothetical protein MVA48_06725 [Blastococcus sp. PRF04-17]
MPQVLAAACAALLLAGWGGGATASGPVPPTPDEPEYPQSLPAEEGTTRCTHEAGFSVAHPSGWSTNPGEVLPACSWFAAQPFTVPQASDVRTADITLRVQSGADLATALPDETARTTVEVGGRPAVRVEQVAGPGLWPEGTPVTTYLVDLGPGGDRSALVADTVGLPGTDYARNVAVLDAMMRSLVLDGAGRL